MRKLIILTCMIFVSLGSYAQFEQRNRNTTKNSKSILQKSNKPKSNYNYDNNVQNKSTTSSNKSSQICSLFAEYNNVYFKNKDADEGTTYNGFSIGLSGDNFDTKGIAFGLAFAFEADFYSKNKVSSTLTSFRIPLKVGYTIGVGDNFHMTPYAFSEMQIYLSASSKYDGGKSTSFFNKDDMGGADATWQRIQIPLGIGLNLNFDKLDLGVQYAWHATCQYGKGNNKGGTLSAHLGYRF